MSVLTTLILSPVRKEKTLWKPDLYTRRSENLDPVYDWETDVSVVCQGTTESIGAIRINPRKETIWVLGRPGVRDNAFGIYAMTLYNIQAANTEVEASARKSSV